MGEGIVGNHPDVNRNGQRLPDFMLLTDSVHVNGACRTPGQWDTRMCKGLWTRQRGGVSSVIDYATVSREHLSSVISLEVDDQGQYGTNSDHNWMFLDLNDRFIKKRRINHVQHRKPKWNISLDQDWSPYQQNISRKISESCSRDDFDVESLTLCLVP